MPYRLHPLLMTAQPATVKAVSAALNLNGELESDFLCRDWPELLLGLEKHPVPAAIVDLGSEPVRALAELESIVARFPETRFVALVDDTSSELLLEAMQAGVRHMIPRSLIARDLSGVLERIVARTGGPNRGSLVTIFSASGGSGATTLAVNLAHELAQATGQTALLVDLDVAQGAAAVFLGLEAPYGVADVLAWRERADAQLVTTTAARYAERMLVLLSPVSTNPPHTKDLAFANLGRLLDACATTCPFTVLDAPRLSPDISGTLAEASALVLLVFQMTVKDLRRVRQMATDLRNRGIAPQSILGVVSRYHKRGPMIRLEEAREVVGDLPLVLLANDFRAASTAMNMGQPLALSAPRSELRRDVLELVQRIRQTADRKVLER